MPRLVLKQDSGYITKKEALPFLFASALSDTLPQFWKEMFPHDDDTIGRYFPSNTQSGHLVICRVLDRTDSMEGFVIMEVGKDGTLLNHGTHSAMGDWCDEDVLKNIRKVGRYFMIIDCGHGSAYGSEHAYIFDRVEPDSSSNCVFLSSYTGMGPYPQMVNYEMEIKDSVIIMHYKVQKGEYKENYDIKWVKDRDVDVMYQRKNNSWAATDSTLFGNMDME